MCSWQPRPSSAGEGTFISTLHTSWTIKVISWFVISYCVNRSLRQIISNCESFYSATSSSALKWHLLRTRIWLRQSMIEHLKYFKIWHLQCCLHCRSEVRNAGAKVALVKAAEELQTLSWRSWREAGICCRACAKVTDWNQTENFTQGVRH